MVSSSKQAEQHNSNKVQIMPKCHRSRQLSLGSDPVTEASESVSSSHKTRKSVSLPPQTVEYLKNWILSPEHINHPYPTEQEKARIMKDTGIEMKQLTNWFVNNRKRFWKPRVEARLRDQQVSGSKADANSSNLTTISLKDVICANANESHFPTTVIMPEGLPTTRSLVTSPTRVVSAQSSVASEPGHLTPSGSLDDLFSAGQATEEFVLTTETIQINILRPSGSCVPTIENVSTDSNTPSDNILKTFDNCAVTYRCTTSDAQDPVKVQSQRDSEILRMKKHYLYQFLSEHQEQNEVRVVTPSKKRRIERVDQPTPRPFFRRVSFELWREACETADSIYDNRLPSLEEAATLFGYKTDETA